MVNFDEILTLQHTSLEHLAGQKRKPRETTGAADRGLVPIARRDPRVTEPRPNQPLVPFHRKNSHFYLKEQLTDML